MQLEKLGLWTSEVVKTDVNFNMLGVNLDCNPSIAHAVPSGESSSTTRTYNSIFNTKIAVNKGESKNTLGLKT